MPSAGRVYVLDTGVPVEHLDRLSPPAKVAESLFEKASKRRPTLYTTSLVLAEANKAASDYVAWLKWSVGLKVRSVDEELALSAGELRKRLGIALTDCTVLACALEAGGVPTLQEGGEGDGARPPGQQPTSWVTAFWTCGPGDGAGR